MTDRKPLKKYTLINDIWVNLDKFQRRLRRRANDCWEWTGAKHTQGYGMVSAIRDRDQKRIMTVAHRVSMRIKLDRPLGPQDDVQHTCGNPLCCNPDHLRLKLTMRERIELERRAQEHDQVPV